MEYMNVQPDCNSFTDSFSTVTIRDAREFKRKVNRSMEHLNPVRETKSEFKGNIFD